MTATGKRIDLTDGEFLTLLEAMMMILEATEDPENQAEVDFREKFTKLYDKLTGRGHQ